MEYILASASPRRKELFSKIAPAFEVCAADIEEVLPSGMSVYNGPEYLAYKKAEHISKNAPDKLVVGADTAVFCDGVMLGKPKNREDAVRMLKLLSGKTHKVITGCAAFYQGRCLSFSEVTEVTFFELSDAEIENYAATGECDDKAGAYGVQGKGALLVKGINGDYYNVVGLPVARLSREIKKLIITG